MNFREAEAYLYSLGNEVAAMKLGLDNIRKLLAALDHPESKFLKVQVAGTNGKGSVCAFLDSICNTAGIKTGTFTSPHLISITERIRINGLDISEDDFARLATRVREMSESLVADGSIESVPTYFEQVTAIALVAFADAGVDLAILETGLGGRLDATTAANAEIAAITSIDLDHQEYLGKTIEEIAAEKAAIITPRTQAVVIGEQTPATMTVIDDRLCKTKGGNTSGSECAVLVAENLRPLPTATLGLKGKHQIENANIAIRLAEALQKYFPITKSNIIAGFENARHPGRLEYIGRYLLDGAHNVGGAKALVAYLDEFEPRPITMIFGGMNDKDIGEMAEILFPKAANIVLTRPDNLRSQTAREIADMVPANMDRERFVLTDSTADALPQAEKIAGPDSTILVTGSLYLVGEAKAILASNGDE
ncbi:MAG: folylpolyglutamate synthase/dihydrofolate synthase family protein [Pyrinomonadaceae bacterium]